MIASLVTGNKVLTNLVLLNNNIGDEGAAALASALRVNGVLKTLDLRYNGIGNEGAAALGKALEVDGVLNTLYILQQDRRRGREGDRRRSRGQRGADRLEPLLQRHP